MSCQIRLTANIQDIPAIRRCLFPTDDLRGSDSWLQLCEISASPTGDIIAIANERRLVILSAKWDSQTSLSMFQIIYSGAIHEYDKVKGILCLPIVSQSQSSHVGPDWTCILIGYDSGYVRFYTENAELLLEEQLHIENITSIKCQSQHSPRPDISPDLHPEEIYIQYQSNICVINGNQLFPVLRNCRSQLAKSGKVEAPQTCLAPKKWGFQDQATINDAAVVGLNLSSTFDHLLTASVCGGFETKYRAMPPHNTLVLATGSKPFVGYHYALEGGAQPVLSDVAKAVASKLKSALPGWLTGNKTQVEKQISVAMQPVETMGCRFGLCDLRRTGCDIVLSPDRKLAVVTDVLGRVMLIDSFKGITLRIFKGYRNAQCSFIQVPDERKSKHKIGNRIALFLVIYSPKRGTLEIFSVQHGMRITTFSASKFSRLLYINYGLMGFTTTSKSRYICQFTTIFIDNDGQVKEFLIPFHFALTEKNNKRSRDIHLYKKLRGVIKSGDFDLESILNDVVKMSSELKTTEIKTQTIEMLLNNRDVPPEATLHCAETFAKKIEEESEPDCTNLKILCDNVIVLLKFYLFLKGGSKESLDIENGNSNVIPDTKFNLGARELNNLQKLLDLNTLNDNSKSPQIKVSFSDTKGISVVDFTSVFDLTKSDCIYLKQNLDESVLFKASEVMFNKYIIGALQNFEELEDQLLSTRIMTKDLFVLLINYWVNRSLYLHLKLEKEMANLSSLIYTLVKTASKEDIVTEYNNISKFWSEIRDILANSSRPFPSLIAAILCKSVAQKIEYERELEQSSTSLEDETLEILSQENVQWTLLIGKLEDVSLLNIILSNKPIATDCPLPKLHQEKIEVSLRYILKKGRGSVSELVAQWLTVSGVNPENIVLNDLLHKKSSVVTDDEKQTVSDKKDKNNTEDVDISCDISEENVAVIKSQPVFDHLNLMKEQFPYSLEASTLLANLCWEYALGWQKDIQNLGNLEASLKCLDCIPNVYIKQGLANLLWNTHLKIICESTTKLINKVGKLPKERLCQQDTGLSDFQITLFIGICTNFLDTFMDVVEQSCSLQKPKLRFEAIWENGSQPLIELAVQQKEINYDLLHLHHQLCTTLQMITTFSIKHNKPVNNLFEASIVALFFTDLQKKFHVNWNKSDMKLNSSRTQFLIKVISASLESVTLNDNKIYSADHVSWMSKCLNIARVWGLDIDFLKRYQVIQLFMNGFDSLAEDLLPAITDLNKLGPELLAVAAKRLSQYISSSPALSENISALSPSLTTYLDTLNGDWCSPSSLDSILSIASRAHACIEEGQPEHKLAELLLDAISTLQEIQNN